MVAPVVEDFSDLQLEQILLRILLLLHNIIVRYDTMITYYDTITA